MIRKISWIKNIVFILLLILTTALAGCTVPVNQNDIPSTSAVETENPVGSSPDGTTGETPEPKSSSTKTKILQVHFIDVGQADCSLLKLPDGQTMLIDGGNNEDGSFIIQYLKKSGVKKIDFLVGTHPHEDHIGGLDTVMETFPVGKVILPNATHTTKSFRDVLKTIKSKKIPVVKATAGKTLVESPNLRVQLIAPVNKEYENLNNYSAVFKVTYGKNAFLFQGDAEAISENEILATGIDLKADVLKIGHHGSSSSTTLKYLDKVQPNFAVISVGSGNDYHHPHEKTLTRLKKAGAKIFRTDRDGTLIFSSDGQTITKSSSPLGHPD